MVAFDNKFIMTVQEIMDMALANTHTKSAQVTAANLLSWFNLVRKVVYRTIVKNIGENFFFVQIDVDAVAGQSEGKYDLDNADNDESGPIEIRKALIKGYSTDDVHTVAREINPKDFGEDWTYFLDNQAKNDPVYFTTHDGVKISIYIAPKFVAADLPSSPSGNEQIKLFATKKAVDLAAGASDNAVLIPDDEHHMIALGMEQYIYKNRGKKKEARDSLVEFKTEIPEMIDRITNRDQSAMIATLPNDRALQFGD
jgi:hypothetical protein